MRLHDQLDEQLKHADGSTWTRQELEITVERVILRFNASSGANTPWLFLDTITPPSTCAWFDSVCEVDPITGLPANIDPLPATCGLTNTIHIVPSNCVPAALGASNLAPPSHIMYIEKFTSGLGGDPRYEHAPGAPANLFESTVIHELGHSLGMLDSNYCFPSWTTVCPTGADPCSIMGSADNNSLVADYFMYDDTQGFRSIYGNRTAPSEGLLEATDLNVGFTGLAIGNVDAHGAFVASSRPVGVASKMTIAGYRRIGSPTTPTVFDWDWSTLAITSLGSPHIFCGNGALGAAHDTNNRYVTSSVFRYTADFRRWNRRLAVSTRSLTGNTWTTALSNPAVNDIDNTITGGVSSAFDPRNGVVLHALRASDGRVLLQDFSGSTFGTPLNTTIKSITSPLIACNNLIAPARNCILVTAEAGKPVTSSATQRLQWIEFTWNAVTNNWTTGSLHTEPFLMWADMSLAVHPYGATFEFVVSYLVPAGSAGEQAYILRKSAGESNGFSLFGGTFTPTPQVTFSVVGGTGSSIEALSFAHP